MLEEALAAGARLKPACDELGIDARTVQRWRAAGVGDDGRHGPRTSPTNKLSDAERRKLLSTANSPEFRNLSPKQIVPRLADRGEYIASESTFYRVLREADQMKHRGPAKPPMRRHRPTPRVATAPNQVWSWDITYLRSTVAGRFFYLYMFVDVWSRKVVAWAVHERECTDLAAQMLEAALQAEGLSDIELVLHSDNGSPMKGATLRATMERLGITPSYSRPSVSNDNPFSESLFATAKGRPESPRYSATRATLMPSSSAVERSTRQRERATRIAGPGRLAPGQRPASSTSTRPSMTMAKARLRWQHDRQRRQLC